ncbi:BTB/POZ and MATH domain-containing protein 2-like [Triticum aestivum]|uniref:BTB/POZ and MATH domain-containing protein 2-like n=1 Tax=Triticum aestivum TaxID=4565 RepID=UPI001D003678|nr:BTB/POZ and MATH domain-containing protein 2-like [Triticum aestivum]
MAFAGVSLIADGRLCASTESVVDSGADSGYHLLVVEGYSRTKETAPNGECIQSRPFIVGGRRWKVEYFPNGFDRSNEDFISVFLVQDEYLRNQVQAHVAFSFIDQPELRVPKLIRQKQPCCFYGDHSLSDQPGGFVTRGAFERSSHLKNDSFVLRCDVVVLDKKDDESDEEEEEEEEDDDELARPFIKLPPSDLPSHFSDLFLSKEGADITFEVGGKEFAAHRCVLAARCTFFKTQLFGAMDKGATAPSVEKIDGIEANVFKGLLTLIYTDGMPDFKDPSLLLQLLEAAERYDLQKLKLICEEKFANLICKNRIAQVIVVAERRRCCWLKEACLEFIKTHTSLHRVFTADGLEQIIRTCRPSVLKELISKFASQEGAAVGAVVEGANDTGTSGQAEDGGERDAGSKKRKMDAA